MDKIGHILSSENSHNQIGNISDCWYVTTLQGVSERLQEGEKPGFYEVFVEKRAIYEETGFLK